MKLQGCLAWRRAQLWMRGTVRKWGRARKTEAVERRDRAHEVSPVSGLREDGEVDQTHGRRNLGRRALEPGYDSVTNHGSPLPGQTGHGACVSGDWREQLAGKPGA